LAYTNPELEATCALTQACTMGFVFNSLLGKPIDTAVQSLEPNSPQLQALSSSNQFDAIVGEAPTPISQTEALLDLLTSIYIPPQTDLSILGGQVNDTIVPFSSQTPSCGSTCATVPGIVHASLVSVDCGETHSATVWAQVFHWLTGGVGDAPVYSIPAACGNPSTSTNSSPSVRLSTAMKAARPADVSVSSGPAPVLDLTGYTQVDASNVTISPTTGTSLTIGSATSISATSTSKAITELLLLQSVSDPTDTFFSFATQSPFAIGYTPTRLGTANFAAITVFSDNTFALTTLNYPLQTSGSPSALTLMNTPAEGLPIGSSTVVQAIAQFSGYPVDVTQAATYSSQSGGSSVFSVGADGTITATGIGEDQLNVSYGGLMASAVISVGPCTYSLSPSSQIVSYDGGTVDIGVAAPAGCNWTATGGSSWLTFTNASGAGSGTITLAAAANTTGSAQSATISLGNTSALLEQAATACAYDLSQLQINALPAGTSGIIDVTTSCPIVISGNASWVTATANGTSSVFYVVAPNTGTTQRTATLTIGTQAVPVVQPAAITPTVTVTPGASSITTLQPLSVTVTVNGGSGNPIPTGAVTLTSGSYSSAATTLTNGSAQINVPSGSLAPGSDMLMVAYAPDTNSAPTYSDALGTASSSVNVSLVTPNITWTPVSTIIYGSVGSNVLNASANTGGSFTYSATPTGGGSPTNITSGTSTLAAGSYNIAANFTPTDTSIYSSAQSIATLVVSGESVWIVDSAGGISELAGNGADITSSADPGANLAVAIDIGGNLWTIGSGSPSLEETSQVGTVLLTIPSGNGGLNSPAAIAIDGNDQVWVTNSNNSVSLFSNAGTALSPSTGFTDTSLSAPNGIAVDLSGSVWIANTGNNSVTRILGAAAPAAPLATAAANKTTGEKP